MKWLGISILVFLFQFSFGQNPLRFEKEVNVLNGVQHHFDPNKTTEIFAGSSSIRKWHDVAGYFPDYNVVNSGFGGSQMSDLLYYLDAIVLKYSPDIVFIYEGDNDLAYGKTPEQILITAKVVIKRIKTNNSNTKIFLLSAKPSPSRWYLKEKYETLNQLYKNLATKQKDIIFVNIWNIMLNNSGKPKPNIFGGDSLHMNKTGYDLWGKEIRKYLKPKQ